MEHYARIENNEIVQFPMTIEDINQRDVPSDTYYPCYYDPEPVYDPLISALEPIPQVIGTSVRVGYLIVFKTLEEALNELHEWLADQVGNTEGITFFNIPSDIQYSIKTLAVMKVQEKLDAFAKTRGYDDIKSACTYAESPNPIFAREGTRAVFVRDTTWSALYSYLEYVGMSNPPWPVAWEEIEQFLPVPSW